MTSRVLASLGAGNELKHVFRDTVWIDPHPSSSSLSPLHRIVIICTDLTSHAQDFDGWMERNESDESAHSCLAVTAEFLPEKLVVRQVEQFQLGTGVKETTTDTVQVAVRKIQVFASVLEVGRKERHIEDALTERAIFYADALFSAAKGSDGCRLQAQQDFFKTVFFG